MRIKKLVDKRIIGAAVVLVLLVVAVFHFRLDIEGFVRCPRMYHYFATYASTRQAAFHYWCEAEEQGLFGYSGRIPAAYRQCPVAFVRHRQQQSSLSVLHEQCQQEQRRRAKIQGGSR